MDANNPTTTNDESSVLEQQNNANYSAAMVDTIFADTLSRGMQNAITSQQNAQMASSSSITNACARILQAKASQPNPIKPEVDDSSGKPVEDDSKDAAESPQSIDKEAPAQQRVRLTPMEPSMEHQQSHLATEQSAPNNAGELHGWQRVAKEYGCLILSAVMFAIGLGALGVTAYQLSQQGTTSPSTSINSKPNP